MAKLPRIPTTPNRIRIAAMLIVLLLAGMVLFFNTGVRNAFYQTTWIVKLPASATDEYMNSFSSSPYLAALDKQNKELQWQGIPNDELNRKVEEIRAQFPNETVTLAEVSELPVPAVITRVIYAGVFALLVSLVYLYFTEVGKFNLRKIFFRASGLNLIALIWSIVVMLGILSSMSLIYKLTIYSFLSLVIMAMWVGIGYYLSLASFEKELVLNLALEKQRSFWRQFNRASWSWLIILTVLLSIGLGTVFVVDGILIAVAVILGGYAQQELPILLPRVIERIRNIRFYKTTPKFKKNTVVKPSNTGVKVNISKPKKAKDTKKKNKKSKRK